LLHDFTEGELIDIPGNAWGYTSCSSYRQGTTCICRTSPASSLVSVHSDACFLPSFSCVSKENLT